MTSLQKVIYRISPVKTGLILFFLIYPLFLKGQSYYFDNYNVEEGLAQSKVYTIAQTRSHHVWLGTISGASRFDGVSFQNFTSEDGLAENSVRAIFEDSKGNIWFGHTEGGLSRFNGKIFENIPPGFLLNKDITNINESTDGGIWISSYGAGAVYISNPDAKITDIKFERYKGNRLSDLVFSCYKMRDGRMFFITDTGIKIYSKARNSFSNFNPPHLPKYFQFTSICEDVKGNIWLGTHNGGLYKYVSARDSVKIYDTRDGLSSNFISCLHADKKGNIWAGTWGEGITRISTNETFTVFNNKNGLQDNYIFKLIEDVEGNILVGTTAHGLSIFKGESMINYSQNNALLNKQITAIQEDRDKRIWFGTNNGITILNPNGKSGAEFTTYTSENSILSEQIRFIKRDRNNNIWIGTEESGVFLYDYKHKSFSVPINLNSLLPSNKGVISMEIDKKNNLWVGTIDGLVYYEIKNQAGQRLTNYHGIAGNEITALFCSSDNVLYVGSKGKGLTIIKDTTRKIFPLENFETPLCFAEGKDKILWIGTESHGVIGFKDGKIVKRYGLKEGMLSNLINFINCDSAGNLYCGTNKGLNRIEIATHKINIYTKRNGFMGIEARKNSTFKDSDGHLWFGTVNGAIKYSPWLDKPKALQPLTHIFRMRVNQKEYDIRKKLVFSSNQNSISFDYSSICLNNPDAVQYQVKLEGVDTEWQPVTTQTSISYPVLPPNKYVFKVRARNSAGIWNETPVSVAFQILPPFYLRWYFILGMVVFSVISLVAFIKIRERNLIIEKSILEDKVQERTHEVMLMNEELAMKNRDVLASIQYAKRIQLSVLPSSIPFDDTFVLFKPKDIVSGDFFWFMEDANYDWMAAVDCTGHGVPGAFMSLIGYNSLNKIVKELHIKEPSEILNRLNEEVTKTLHQYGAEESINDGMDLSLVRYNKITHELDYSGAFNPLWIIRRGELIEIRADRFAIASKSHEGKTFSKTTTQLQSEDSIYMFSDGYADQFGGPDNKKYKTAKFKEYLLSIQEHPIENQKHLLEENIEKWRGNQVQVDDILILGRKFTF